jgi:hypothetical protein
MARVARLPGLSRSQRVLWIGSMVRWGDADCEAVRRDEWRGLGCRRAMS